jgi:hypothetical protein
MVPHSWRLCVGWTGKQTNKQTNRQTGKQTTNKQTNKQTNKETKKQPTNKQFLSRYGDNSHSSRVSVSTLKRGWKLNHPEGPKQPVVLFCFFKNKQTVDLNKSGNKSPNGLGFFHGLLKNQRHAAVHAS